jgi:hypothetical protein
MPTCADELPCVILLAELAAATTVNNVGVTEASPGVMVLLLSVLGMALAAVTANDTGEREAGLEQSRMIVDGVAVRKLVLTMVTATETSGPFGPAVREAA